MGCETPNAALAQRIADLTRRESELTATLKECLTLLENSAVIGRPGKCDTAAVDRLALIRKIEELLK